MIRFVICMNILLVYIIYVAGKLHPKALTPASGWVDYFFIFSVGISFLFACVAVWRAKDFEL